MAFDVDFLVIGAGSGGVRAARIAAGHGAKTLVAEESRIGGTCVIRGCVPKKLYVYASRFADDFRDAAGFGWSVGEATLDWPALVRAKDKEISRLSDAYRENLARSGAKLIEERAIVVDPHRVRLAGGQEVSARHILVACGSRPALPEGVEGLEHAITSNEIFDLPGLPAPPARRRRRLYRDRIRGAVPAARRCRSRRSCARPTFCAASTTTCATACATRWLAPASFSASARCRPASKNRATARCSVTLSDGAVVEADQALIATGRLPDTRGLGLESAGVELSAAHGAVMVDENLTSNVPSIHAIGDATHRVDLTPVAIREGHTLADRLFGKGAPRSATTRSRARCSARPKWARSG